MYKLTISHVRHLGRASAVARLRLKGEIGKKFHRFPYFSMIPEDEPLAPIPAFHSPRLPPFASERGVPPTPLPVSGCFY